LNPDKVPYYDRTKPDQIRQSMMTTFPQDYKFFGIKLWINLDSTRYTRTAYTLMDWGAQVGGVIGTLHSVILMLIGLFSSFNIQNLIAN
jgi:hypothetical protein